MSNITIRKLQNAQNKFSKEEINQAARNLSELKIYNNQNTIAWSIRSKQESTTVSLSYSLISSIFYFASF
jgi:hypothetical protein